VDSLKRRFGKDWKNSSHPLVGRLWDYAKDCGQQELFLGLPSLMNMSCDRCTTITMALDDKESEEGGILRMYFSPWVLEIVSADESFNISERNLWAAWQYHFNDAKPFFETCSICHRPLSLISCSDSDPRKVWRTVNQLLIGPYSEYLLKETIPETESLCRPPVPTFGLSQVHTELSMISTSLFLATRLLEISDVSLSFLDAFPFMPIYFSENYVFPVVNRQQLPQVDLKTLLVDLDSIYSQTLQYFLRIHKLDMSRESWKDFDLSLRYSLALVNLNDLRECETLVQWFCDFCNKWTTSPVTASSGIVACKLIVALSLLTSRVGNNDLSKICNPIGFRTTICKAISMSTSELLFNPRLQTLDLVYVWWFLLASHLLESVLSLFQSL